MSDPLRFVLVSGLSGAGKGQALRFLEDLGYYCVDNLPAPLIPTFADLIRRAGPGKRRFAVCVDARTGEDLRNVPGFLEETSEMGIRPEIVFMDSSDAVLLHRYSESRRRHPCAPAGSVEEGIRREREILEPIRARADLLLDTSASSVAELREHIATVFLDKKGPGSLVITVMSFGFKYGAPPEAEMLYDVRFLPNPHYDPEMRPSTGTDPAVRDYVLRNDDAREFLERIKNLLKFLMPRYAAEPKSYLTVAVGCTGGRHRSVAVAQEIALFLRSLKYEVRVRHRDVGREG